METPELNSKKGQKANSAIFLLNDTNLDIVVEEKHFNLERDEEAFIKAMQE